MFSRVGSDLHIWHMGLGYVVYAPKGEKDLNICDTEEASGIPLYLPLPLGLTYTDTTLIVLIDRYVMVKWSSQSAHIKPNGVGPMLPSHV